MRKLIAGGIALALAAAALPALAGDLLYEAAPDTLTERLSGQPYWVAQAQCAGLYGGAAVAFDARGDAAAADQARSNAVSFANDAIARLSKDRSLTKAQALDAISPTVLEAREEGKSAVERDVGAKSTWNFARSSCLDLAEAYSRVASR